MTTNDINELHNSIIEIFNLLVKKDNVDLELIENLTGKFAQIGSFTPSKWPLKQVKIWESSLGEVAKKTYSKDVLGLLVDALAKSDEHEKEPLEFLILEVRWNIFKDLEDTLNLLKRLTSTYPHNSIFFLYFGNHLGGRIEVNTEDLELAYKKTLEYLSFTPPNNTYNLGGTALSVCLRLFYKYVEMHQYDKAQKLFEAISEVKHFKNDTALRNIIFNLPFAIMQGRSQYQLNLSVTERINKDLAKQSEEVRKKSFEQLVIFTAVITFLITAANSISSASFPLLGIGVLGYTLLTFVLAILMCLDKPESLWRDNRFKILLGSSIMALVISACSLLGQFSSLCIYNCGPTSKNVEVINILPDIFSEESKEFGEIKPPWKLE
ncbi:DUF4231 domain-containing protein [Vibrio splendidus]|uniref:DUF4231 domain-containing protein n=1 Tax=Vibrio splendidus TaxID=29497 RepID=UPI000C85F00A|nr:DUF4231 domain-containing protein [Vibrio splendidus]PMN36966.1 hypothetical protein BCT36_24225 [Vibrio splendidus]